MAMLNNQRVNLINMSNPQQFFLARSASIEDFVADVEQIRRYCQVDKVPSVRSVRSRGSRRDLGSLLGISYRGL
jgi:hypothetical protein